MRAVGERERNTAQMFKTIWQGPDISVCAGTRENTTRSKDATHEQHEWRREERERERDPGAGIPAHQTHKNVQVAGSRTTRVNERMERESQVQSLSPSFPTVSPDEDRGRRQR